MNVVNLTGRIIHLENDDGVAVTLPTHGPRARVVSRPRYVDPVAIYGVEVLRIIRTERRIIDLPDPEEDTIFLVSGVVADAAQREDVWAVGEKMVANGRVHGAHVLVRYER